MADKFTWKLGITDFHTGRQKTQYPDQDFTVSVGHVSLEGRHQTQGGNFVISLLIFKTCFTTGKRTTFQKTHNTSNHSLSTQLHCLMFSESYKSKFVANLEECAKNGFDLGYPSNFYAFSLLSGCLISIDRKICIRW